MELGPCITEQQFEAANKAVSSFQATHRGGPVAGAVFGFFPQAGTPWQDIWINNFCDLDPSSPGFVDFSGTDFTYDGHMGHDCDIRGFDEQTIGVPIYAALDGTVIQTADGNFDRNTQAGNLPANYVILDHGNGFSTWYWHMKSGSVLVHPGQVVRAGTQLGSTGSSGSSTGPHLHFQCMQNGQFFEPNAGPLRPGPSNWENQIPIPRQTYLSDFEITDVDTAGWAGPPFEWPRKGKFVAGFFNMWNIASVQNLPVFSNFRLLMKNSQGTTLIDSGTQSFGNSIPYRSSYWTFFWNLNLPNPGQYSIQFFVNGSLLKSVPFSVVSPGGVVNSPPNPITAVMDPIRPGLDLPVFCRVVSDLVLDDPDFDVVRYHYVWKIDGNTVRDIVSAGRADCIPTGTLTTGSHVTCTVTPMDGQSNGPTATAVVRCIPGTFALLKGIFETGSLSSFYFSDDARYVAKRSLNRSADAPIQIEVDSVNFSPTTSDLSITVEARASSAFIIQSVDLYDFTANAWVTANTGRSSTTDSVRVIHAPGAVGRFVGPAGLMRAKISYQSSGWDPMPRRFDLLTPFEGFVDQVVWSVTP